MIASVDVLLEESEALFSIKHWRVFRLHDWFLDYKRNYSTSGTGPRLLQTRKVDLTGGF